MKVIEYENKSGQHNRLLRHGGKCKNFWWGEAKNSMGVHVIIF